MKKGILIICLLLGLILFLSEYSFKIHRDKQLEKNALSEAFRSSGAKPVNSEVYFWGRLSGMYRNVEQLSVLEEDFINVIGIVQDETFQKTVTTNDNVKKIQIQGKCENDRIIDISMQISKTGHIVDDRFITVTVNQDSTAEGLEDIKEAISKVLKKYRIKPKVNYCITGAFEGKMDTVALNEMSKKIFIQAEAKRVSGIRDRNLISVTAYSPAFVDYIHVNGAKVNINLAIRYNSYENRTYIWLGTPMITTEY